MLEGEAIARLIQAIARTRIVQSQRTIHLSGRYNDSQNEIMAKANRRNSCLRLSSWSF